MNRSRNMKIAGILKESIDLGKKIEIPTEVEIIKNAFTRLGFKLYVVGGAVRDTLIGKEPKDYDLATNATPDEIKMILDKFGINNFPKGEQFGVISAIINKEEFEIATFRKESYEGGDGRRPTNVEFSDMEDDAMRRDLTINALYYDIDKEKIIDLVGGIHDIENRRVKMVGNPEDRMFEDRLRIMRAIRFKNVMGGTLDTATQRAILKYKEMSGVSNERIRDEFYAGLEKSQSPEQFLNDLNDFGILPRMFPSMSLNLNFQKGLRNPVLVVGLLLKDNNVKDVFNVMTKMKYKKDEKKSINLMYKFFNFFKGFNKSDVSVEAEADNFDRIVENKVSGLKSIGDDEFMMWAKINGIDENIAKSFLSFQKRSSLEMPEIQDRVTSGEFSSKGREIGDATKIVNFTDFLNSI